jgi:hypothetical protein
MKTGDLLAGLTAIGLLIALPASASAHTWWQARLGGPEYSVRYQVASAPAWYGRYRAADIQAVRLMVRMH